MWNISPQIPSINLTAKPNTFIKESSATFRFEIINGLSFNHFECEFEGEIEFTACTSGVTYNLALEAIFV